MVRALCAHEGVSLNFVLFFFFQRALSLVYRNGCNLPNGFFVFLGSNRSLNSLLI